MAVVSLGSISIYQTPLYIHKLGFVLEKHQADKGSESRVNVPSLHIPSTHTKTGGECNPFMIGDICRSIGCPIGTIRVMRSLI